MAESLERRQLLSVTATQMTCDGASEGQPIPVVLTASTTSGQGTNWLVVANGDTQNPIFAFCAEGQSTTVNLPPQEAGSVQVTAHVTDAGDGSDSGVDADPVSAGILDAGISLSAMSDVALLGPQDSFGGILASVSDADPLANPGLYSVQVDWGDGQQGQAAVQWVNGALDVIGNHFYSSQGTYNVAVDLTDSGGEFASAESTVTTHYRPGVVGATLSVPQEAIEGQDVQGVVYGTTLSGTGTDWFIGVGGTTIQTWDPEGTNSVVDLGPLAAGNYDLSAHVIDASASPNPADLWYDPGVFFSSPLSVADAPISFVSANSSIQEGDGTDGIILGTILDQNPYANASQFSVGSLTWSDGSAAGPLQVVYDPTQSDGSQSAFLVQTPHQAFANAGTPAFSFQVSDEGGAATSAGGIVQVTDAPISFDLPPIVYLPSIDPRPPQVIGTLDDQNPLADASEYSGSIVSEEHLTEAAVSFAAVPGSPGQFTILSDVQWSDQGMPGAPQDFTLNVADGPDTVSADGQLLVYVATPSLAAVPASATEVDLSWSRDPAAPPAVYTVERSTDDTNWSPIATTGDAQLADTTVAAGAGYYYRIDAADPAGTFSSAPVQVVAPPDAPAGMSFTAVTASSVSLAWSASAGATGYAILRQGPSDAAFSQIGQTTETTFTDTTAAPNTTYAYEITANDSGGSSIPSDRVSATTHLDLGLTATTVSASEVDLTWTWPAGADSVQLQRSTDGTTWTPVTTFYTGQASFNDTALAENTLYYYQLVVTNAGTTNQTDQCGGQTLPAVSDLIATAASTSEIDLTWTNNAPDATGYEIDRSTSDNTWITLATGLAPNQSSFRDTGLSADADFLYRVRASRPSGWSNYCDFAEMSTIPEAPAAASVTQADRAITVAWVAASSNDTGVILERSSDNITFESVVPRDENGMAVPLDPSLTSYTDNDVSDGLTYYYRLRVQNIGGISDPSGSASVDIPIGVPSGLTASVPPGSSSEIDLAWTNNSDAQTVTIERSTDGQAFDWLADLQSPVTTYADTDVQPGTQYYYRVRASTGEQTSDPSNVASATTTPTLTLEPDAGQDAYVNEGDTARVDLWADYAQGLPDPITSLAIDWGDGNTTTPDNHTGPFDHVYTRAGTFTVTATAQTAAGPVSATTSLQIAQVEPQLSITQSAYSIPAGGSLTLTPQLTLPPNATLQKYVVDWGDGTTDSNLTHTYTAPGDNQTYNISVVAITSAGAASAGASVVIPFDVSSWPIEDGTGVVSLTGGAFSEGIAGTYYLAGYNPDGPAASQFTVNFGDGTTTQPTPDGQDGSAFESTFNHTYAEEGLYFATATGNDGSLGYWFANVTDETTPVTFTPIADQVATPGSPVTVSTTVSGLDPGEPYTAWIDWGDGRGKQKLQPTNNGDGTATLTATLDQAPVGDLTATVSVCDADGDSATAPPFQISAPLNLSLTPYRTGPAYGQPLSPADKASDDPTQDVILTNNGYHDEQQAGPQGSNKDLERITLPAIPNIRSGTVTISLSDENAVELFKSDGSLFYHPAQTGDSMLQLSLSNPSGYLAGVTSGPLDLWVQGLKADPDFVFSISYTNASGYSTSDQVHIDLVNLQYLGSTGAPVSSVSAVAPWIPAFAAQGFDNVPAIPATAEFKVAAQGLPTNALSSLTVTSATVTSDSYVDQPDPNAFDVLSQHFALIYQAPPDFQIAASDRLAIYNNLGLNVVHNDSAPTVTLVAQAAGAGPGAPATGGGTRPGPAPLLTPLSPRGETATLDFTGLVLNWNGGENATSFNVEQLNSDGTGWFQLNNTPIAPNGGYVVTLKGAPGTVYSFRVVAVNKSGQAVGNPIRYIAPGAAGDAEYPLKSMVFNSLKSAEGAAVTHTYYWAAHVDDLFNQEFAELNKINYATGAAAGTTGQFSPKDFTPGNDGTMYLVNAATPPSADTAVHETGHALDKHNSWNRLAASREAFAYSLERTLAAAAAGISSMAKLDTFTPSGLSTIPWFWSSVWTFMDLSVVGTGASYTQVAGFQMSHTITSADVTAMQKNTGLAFSESGLTTPYRTMFFNRGFAANLLNWSAPAGLSACFR